MYSILYIIGAIVVIIVVLRLLGLFWRSSNCTACFEDILTCTRFSTSSAQSSSSSWCCACSGSIDRARGDARPVGEAAPGTGVASWHLAAPPGVAGWELDAAQPAGLIPDQLLEDREEVPHRPPQTASCSVTRPRLTWSSVRSRASSTSDRKRPRGNPSSTRRGGPALASARSSSRNSGPHCSIRAINSSLSGLDWVERVAPSDVAADLCRAGFARTLVRSLLVGLYFVHP